MSGRDVVRVLEAHGFAQVRQRGSHIILQRIEGEGTITAVVPDHKEMRFGTLQSVVRQSQLPRALFEE